MTDSDKIRCKILYIADSPKFLDLPLSAQNLYFQLTLRMKSNGYIDISNDFLERIGSSRSALTVLMEHNYITFVNLTLTAVKVNF